MPKTCPSCSSDLTSRRSSAWVPIVTAVGISAAALFVFARIRQMKGGGSVEAILDHCSRAASQLDQRLGDAIVSLAGS